MSVLRQIKRAELHFVERDVRLYGSLVQMSEEGAAIRLDAPPPDLDLLRPQTPVSLIVITSSMAYRAKAHIVVEKSGVVFVAYSQGAASLERRRGVRAPCHFSVAFRSLHTGDTPRMWQMAQTVDIGMGGMGMRVGAGVQIPPALQLRFFLPGDSRPVLATARLAHVRKQTDSTKVCGLTFTRLSVFDQIRLSRYLSDALFGDSPQSARV